MSKTANITNEVITDYLNTFYEPLTKELSEFRQYSENRDVPVILRETEDFLSMLIDIVKPKRILEIGTAVGYSACFFAEKISSNRKNYCNESDNISVYTIEKDHDTYLKACNNVEKMGYSQYVHTYEGDGEEIIKRLINEDTQKFDMVFIDAAKSHYKRFFEASLELSKEGALIVCDNTLFQAKVASDMYDPYGKHKTNIKKMREFNDYVSNDPRFSTSVLSVGDGLTIIKLL